MAIMYFRDDFVDESEALIPVTTHALHYGTSIFEGIRSYGDTTRTRIFRPLEHFERFLRNAKLLRMEPRWTAAELVELTAELLRRNNHFTDTYIRPLLYKSATQIGAHIFPGEELVIFTAPWKPRPFPPPPQTATWSKWRRNSGLSVPAGAKISGLYVNSALSIDDAMQRGFNQSIMLSVTGEVAEGYGANLFAVFGNEIVTPPASADILTGITRNTLIEHFETLGDVTMKVESISPERLVTADELFLCGTGLEVVPLVSIDGTPVGKGERGPVTEAAARWYRDLVTGKIDAPDGWIVEVTSEVAAARR
jgi:branched-chain amino acid aminotransferase